MAAKRSALHVEKLTYFEVFCYLNSSWIRKSFIFMVMSSSAVEFTLSQQNSVKWRMFLLVIGRHVCALQRGTNMASPYKALITRISESRWVSLHINLLTFLRFFLDFIYWKVLIRIFRGATGEKQQYCINMTSHLEQPSTHCQHFFFHFWRSHLKRYVVVCEIKTEIIKTRNLK